MGYANAEMRLRRRSLLKSLAGAPAIAAIPTVATPAPAQTAGAAADAAPKLALSAPDIAADGVTRFFTKAQFETLEKLADVLVPALQGRPSATQAGAHEFLDFLIGQSPAPVQQLYKQGLDELARKGISDETLAPLKQPWSYELPSDPFARFLHQAKADILQATVNSREWAESTARGRRGASSSNYFWRNLD